MQKSFAKLYRRVCLEVRMIVNRSFKFRIFPNQQQKNFINNTIGSCRFIYNKMLSDRTAFYNETGKNLNVTPSQYKEEFTWLKEVDAYALCNEQINLQRAFKAFFGGKGKVSYPVFKSKHRDKASYTTNNVHNRIKFVDESHINLPKMNRVRVSVSKKIPSDYIIKSVTITRTPTNKYFISILTEYESQVPEIELNKEKSIGLDYSSHDFYVDSNGASPNYPKFFRVYEDKLAREQRKLSKMVKGSNNYKKQRVRVAKINEKISNCRLDFLHKLSTELVNLYDFIFIEDLDLSNLKRTLNLGKSTSDNGFGKFREFLKYKMADRGKILFTIDKWFPSSKTCHECGCINRNLTLNDRVWICPNCGRELQRDFNAALNIRDCGLSQFFNINLGVELAYKPVDTDNSSCLEQEVA